MKTLLMLALFAASFANASEILWTKVLCKEADRYIGWPTVCTRKSGELFAVFSGDRDGHICPWGKVQMIRSNDGGKTWSAPANICNTPLDDRDAGILELPDGRLLVAWFTGQAYQYMIRDRSKLKPGTPAFFYAQHHDKIEPETVKRWLGAFTRRSADGGKTWDEPVRTPCSAPHGPILLSDGRLLYIGKTGDADANKRQAVVAVESRDNGGTWNVIGEIPFPQGANFHRLHEPHAAEAADGSIVALIRHHEYGFKDNDYYLRQSVSRDGGKTWSLAEKTPIAGYPAHILRLKDNRLLAVYGRRWGKFGEYACLSSDNGKTWDVENEVLLAPCHNGDLGYPASTQLADGTVLTVYYQPEKPGEKTCLMGTLWKP